ncbi:MAG: sigma 54-interacting transcriptional regulator [Acidaminococcales bacterium]|jgi:transcriptional regulator with PAS, ATPase and Fis domain|nr:sigma 54-interacting transcriptional regulator [Acidaminococcales bacterium]
MNKYLGKYLSKETIKLFDMFSEGIVITDENMVVCYINNSFFDYSLLESYEQIIGKKLPDVRKNSRLPEVMKTKKPLLNIHRIIPQGEGFSEAYVDLLPFFREDTADMEIIGVLIVVRDTKVLKALFDRLKEEKESFQQLDKQLRGVFSVKFSFKNVIGVDSDFCKIARKASKSDGPVLLLGESGVGKEVIAQSIHNASQRKDGPFVDVNCAALPENLLESELFGYAPGAFTGANKSGKMGLFEVASGGTIFLDEITEMPLSLQSRLLRVLEEKHLRRLGETKNTNIDVRVIAASNKNIERFILNGGFREDLFFRLAVYMIEIPPLRARKEDLLAFIKYFLKENSKKTRRELVINDEAMNMLLNYHWPGNVRELKNTIEYLCDVVDTLVVGVNDLPKHYILPKQSETVEIKSARSKKLPEILDSVEKSVLAQELGKFEKTLAGRKKMAKKIGISVATLYNKLRKYKLL